MRVVRGELKAILAAADVAGDVLVVGSWVSCWPMSYSCRDKHGLGYDYIEEECLHHPRGLERLYTWVLSFGKMKPGMCCNTPGVWLPHLHLHFINMSIIHPFMSLELYETCFWNIATYCYILCVIVLGKWIVCNTQVQHVQHTLVKHG